MLINQVRRGNSLVIWFVRDLVISTAEIKRYLNSNIVDIQGRVIVEQIGNKSQIQLVHSVDDIFGGDEAAASQFVSLLKHNLSTGQSVIFPQSFQCDTSIGRCDLIQ